jgi:hypothetical protein
MATNLVVESGLRTFVIALGKMWSNLEVPLTEISGTYDWVNNKKEKFGDE